MKMRCSLADKCWRLAYSRYIVDKGYSDNPPSRMEMLCVGYATQEMCPHKGVYADNFPHRTAEGIENLCPEYNGKVYQDCHERNKYLRWAQHLDNKRKQKNTAQRVRKAIPQGVRRLVAKRAHHKCEYCGVAHGQYRDGARVRTCVDHHIPLNRGGHPTDPGKHLAEGSPVVNGIRVAGWRRHLTRSLHDRSVRLRLALATLRL